MNSKHLAKSFFGFDRIIGPILKNIKEINEAGKFKIDIKFFAGDTPAQQALGGFIESVGQAKYPCRECLVEKEKILDIKKESDCVLRDTVDIKKQIEDEKFTKGLKRDAAAYALNFDPIKNTPQDPMHVILEGIARRLIQDFIKSWVQLENGTRRAELSEINARIKNFNYNTIHMKDKIKTNIIENDLYKNEIIIQSSHMKVLLELLPLIFNDIIDTTSMDYKLINLLRKITMITFDFEPSEQALNTLEVLIEKFIDLWQLFYGEKSGFPKLHYLVHLPKWIRK